MPAVGAAHQMLPIGKMLPIGQMLLIGRMLPIGQMLLIEKMLPIGQMLLIGRMLLILPARAVGAAPHDKVAPGNVHARRVMTKSIGCVSWISATNEPRA
jgi:hypothetical protein